MSDSSVDLRALSSTGPVHFVGVGGAGMCALAELVVRMGGRVSGCDAKDSQALRDLSELGVDVELSHSPAHTEQAVGLVVTAAMPWEHPELQAARARGIPIMKRAEALGAWVSGGTVVAIAGTHGKTTTTAMATEVLVEAGLDPTGLVGGRVNAWGGNLRFGSDALFVVEADEYDRSFLTLTPDVAVVTNLEADHLDIYGSLDGVREGFKEFLSGVRTGGRVIVCADDHGAASLLPGLGEAGYTYGTSAGSMLRAVDVRIDSGQTRCRILEEGRDVGALALSAGGGHNLLNAFAAAAVARALGVEWGPITDALAGFGGVGRRFDRLGGFGGVVVIDDYAHHPTEIRAAIAAVRGLHPEARLVAAFQPHLYSRTRDFAEEFGDALSGADVAWVTDVFPAREDPIPGVSGKMVAVAAESAGSVDVHYHERLETLAERLAGELRSGDVLLTLGAGSIEELGPAVLSCMEIPAHA